MKKIKDLTLGEIIETCKKNTKQRPCCIKCPFNFNLCEEYPNLICILVDEMNKELLEKEVNYEK